MTRIPENIRRAVRIAVLITAVLGVMLMILPGRGESEAVSAELSRSGMTEQKLKGLCEMVDGVGEATVAMTFAADDESRICGIGIVCDGGDDPITREKLISLVSAACGVGANKIYVAGAKARAAE